MAALDLILYFVGGGIAIALTTLGGTVSSTKPWHKKTFIALGIGSFVIYAWIGIRAFTQSRAASAEAAQVERKHQQDIDDIKGQLNASEIKRASDTRYLQGKLEVFAQFAPAILELAKASEENTRKQYEQKLLTNKELRDSIADVVKRMRDWQDRYRRDSDKIFNKYRDQTAELFYQARQTNSTVNQQKLSQVSSAEVQEITDLTNRYDSEFNGKILGDAIYVKQQLDSRIAVKDRPEVPPTMSRLLLVFQGILVGPDPADAAAAYLENYAKKLFP